MYYVINRETTEYEVYKTEKEFKEIIKQLNINIELKGREYYDWYE